MKIIFLFDQVDAEGKLVAPDSAPFVTTPDKLNLRQIAPGLSSIGIVFEQTNEQGETQQFFRQIVNFPIDLKQPEPAPIMAPAQVPQAATPTPASTPEVAPKVKRARKSTSAPAPVASEESAK
jgi:hypothetical protein